GNGENGTLEINGTQSSITNLNQLAYPPEGEDGATARVDVSANEIDGYYNNAFNTYFSNTFEGADINDIEIDGGTEGVTFNTEANISDMTVTNNAGGYISV